MKIFIYLIFLALPLQVFAIDYTFIKGGDDVSWDDPGNWNPYGVPGQSDTARIDNDSVRINSVASAKVVFISNTNPNSSKSATLLITSNGSLKLTNGLLKIFGPTYTGLNIGLRNSGNLILFTSSLSISSGCEARNNATGSITFNANSYLANTGVTKNFVGGTIEMMDAVSNNIVNSGQIINRGLWLIHDGTYGILNLLGGQILNLGTLEVYNISPGYGIKNEEGEIRNKGLLNIYNTTEPGIKEIANQSNGILINDTTGTWIVKSAMLCYSDITNHGNMQLSAYGEPSLETHGSFYNYDSLTISINNTNVGMRVYGYFLNDTSAYLLSDKIYYEPPADLPFLIDFFGDFDNHGHVDLHLKNLIKGIDISGNLMRNSGIIYIHNVKETALNLNAKILNLPSGEINIDSVFSDFTIGTFFEDSGVELRDTLINEGDIEMWYYERIGWKNNSGAWLVNKGKLEFSRNIGTDNIIPLYFAQGYFKNDSTGLLRVMNFHDVVANQYPPTANTLLRNEAIFENYGEVLFLNSEVRDMIKSQVVGSSPVTSFKNYGKISTENVKAADNGILANSLFVNDTCATLSITGNIKIGADGNFKNYGLLDLAEFISLDNQGLWEHFGVISSPDKNLDGYFTPLNGLLFYPQTHAFSNNKTLGSGIIYGINPYIVGSEISRYSLSQYLPVGNFNAITNSITMNYSQSFDLEKIYFEINTPAGCAIHVKAIGKNQAFECYQIRNSVFIGTDQQWYKPSNWSDSKSPNYCANLSVPNGKRLKLDTNNFSAANKFETEAGSIFEAETGSVLDIRNDH